MAGLETVSAEGDREQLQNSEDVHDGYDVKALRTAVFYFGFACLLYPLWRLVDLLVQLQFTDEYERINL